MDVRDAALEKLMKDESFSAILHLAGLKAPVESIQRPLDYYSNNIGGLLSLCQAMARSTARVLIFSSSATVYGISGDEPLCENTPLNAANPYGFSKLAGERILDDIQDSDPAWRIGCLRYFNPVGAHESGLIGEDPKGYPNNLMPRLARVAADGGTVSIFGGDYPTVDGTGVRDYIHVVDLAKAHVAALTYLLGGGRGFTANIGTGSGHSVLEVLKAYEQACGKTIRYEMKPRRPGDVASCFADPALARKLLQWRAERDLGDMCRDSWRWQRKNPHGYQ